MDPLQVHADHRSQTSWRLATRYRKPNWPHLVVSLLFLLFQITLSAADFIPLGLAGTMMRPIGTNTPGAAGKALKAVTDRIHTAARPGPAPTDTMVREYMADLEKYLQDWPDSPWNPAVRQELAELNSTRMHYDAAIKHWRTNFETFLGSPDPIGRQYGHQAAAWYTRHLLIASKMEELGPVLERLRGIALDDGPLMTILERTRQKYVATQRYPWMSFKCGIFALDRLARDAGWTYPREQLLETRSGTEGICLNVSLCG